MKPDLSRQQMKFTNYLLILISVFFPATLVQAQELDISGHWVGVATYEKQNLVLNIDFFSMNDTMVGACRIPEWEPDMLGTSAVKIEGKKVSFQLSGFGSAILQYDEKFDRLRGQSVNRNGVFNLQLSRVIQPAEKLYYNKTFNVPSSAGAILKAELIVPETMGKHPLAIFFGDKNEGSRHTQRGRALMLARRGIAALIFDRRGEGESNGDVNNVTLNDYVADGLAMIDFAGNRENVDPQQIGLIGFGTGADVVHYLAAQKNDLAFVVNIAGSIEDTWQQRWHALESAMNRAEDQFSTSDYAEAKTYMDLVNTFAATRQGWPEVVKNIEKNSRQKWSLLTELPKNPNSPEFSWLFRFQSNPAEKLPLIKNPYLALFAELDTSLAASVNAELAGDLLAKAAHPDYQAVIIPGAEHNMFIHQISGNGKSKDPAAYRWRRVSPIFNPLLLQWLEKHVTKVR